MESSSDPRQELARADRAAALLTVVLVTVGLTVYERRYARAAAATRSRLA